MQEQSILIYFNCYLFIYFLHEGFGKRDCSSQNKDAIQDMKIAHDDQLLQKMFQFIEDHLQLTAEEKQYSPDFPRSNKN